MKLSECAASTAFGSFLNFRFGRSIVHRGAALPQRTQQASLRPVADDVWAVFFYWEVQGPGGKWTFLLSTSYRCSVLQQVRHGSCIYSHS